MFDEGQLYSPVTTGEDGTVEVHLADNHPGLHDPAYRARRSHIAAAAINAPAGTVPVIDYTEDEHRIWRLCQEQLAPKHEKYAHSEFLAAKHRLRLPTDHVPQLDQVSARLRPLTGWGYRAAPGLVPLREFYADLGARTFNSTQYLRHGSEPLYTPEPDIIHEVIGHGNQLASPRFARLTEAAGRASVRLETEDAMKFVADVFWFSMEFGVVKEHGEVKAYGAGILSSFGEMDEFGHMEHRGLDLADMGTLAYDITEYQPVLFCAQSLDELDDVVGVFFDTVDDDLALRLRADAAAR
ncbi:MAG TPA: phenylalanine 4-monooxygenase [Phycicoccus elongatus]|uniref:phenylalanine 4-monooxygenase n=1 Tax=Phycicoccus TaxID=367298 RepID=UPI001D66337A|nr:MULTISPECIES: phenylalanine 4-monooxygenase [Phycicoccus]MCB1238069.1 phenylalanine 4-monooxygenase [Tetrasphaera sp.]MCB9406322.1 phenylalanine 4-monooxygenase [Tetrasphaera sp.]MCO5304301.1 phenylalanine 4-monooxygenase [Phycicoccus sp.]HPK12939.1 phenylalanine 4-monooxygenase [Phycicoccus elongatus]HPQ73055.1 phenylalanine 4-monooxygenase [Phycicoccus elongatus]